MRTARVNGFTFRELREELQIQKRNLRDAKKDLKVVERDIQDLRKQLREFPREVAIVRRKVPRTVVGRYKMFNKVVRQYTSAPIYRDRMPDGRLSIKIGSGRAVPKNVDHFLRKLANSSREYLVFSEAAYFMDEKGKPGTRYYFKGIPAGGVR